jgi:enterochelin esterase-like enzyme
MRLRNTCRGPMLAASLALLWGVPSLQTSAQQAPVTAPGQPSANAPAPGRGRGAPAIVSPEIGADRRVTLRIYAPHASAVSVRGDVDGSLVPDPNAVPATAAATNPAAPSAVSQIPGFGRGGPPAVVMSKGDNGVWSGTTIRAVKPGAWRYNFNIDGTTVVDANNVDVSPSQTQVQSLLVVPGDFSETRNVPHGAVGLVRYFSKALGGVQREMYVYTPPGYEKGGGKYPVLYLIHGGGDTAISWSTVGRANNILDNLLADKKAVPMIIVMPSGWTPAGGQVMTSDATKDPFNAEMLQDIIPYIEANYRTMGTSEGRALSGLSMGGIQTLNIGLENLGEFRYVAVMSSGWVSDDDRNWFYQHEAAQIPKYNSSLKLFWWGWGQTDIARQNGLKVIGELQKDGVKIETYESPGGHEWPNWRLYLYLVAPKLFR